MAWRRPGEFDGLCSPWVHKESDTTELLSLGASLVAQRVKCLPAMRETRVQSLGWEDSLEKEMATHSSIRSLFTIYLTYSAVCVSRSVVSDPL